jgi:uncharacterized protein
MRKIDGEQVLMRVFMSEDLPLVIEVVDIQEHLDAVLPEVDRLMRGGLTTMEKVRVLRYTPEGG